MLADANADLAANANAGFDDEPIASASQSQPQPLSSSTKSALPKGKGRLIRDAEGKVIGVDLPSDDEGMSGEASSEAMNGPDEDTPWGTPMKGDRPVIPVLAKTSVARSECIFLSFYRRCRDYFAK